ncbi:sporulation integral membrane protein YtvI [Calidifontibacillus erzurumensis]|uniref:Sporulation integral membrane protein YtvI n=1 Tax=Calidifontibacillus erzurumensis TaxID=2741433 RepID=A0A8J8GCG3_9BACI|nr:sporulation integral membrane protein YtvI [Calidifontibacillus erzurumensis]NSL51274.1 sporulation integral membrane protein YtvI [Calidifontibacillus erzurumensis]
MNSTYLHATLRFLLVLAIVVITPIVIYYISTVTYPFIIAFFIALMMNPLVNFLEAKTKMPRTLAVIIVMVLIIGGVAGLLTLLIAEIISGSNYLAKVVPKQFENLVVYIEQYVTDQIIPFYNQILILFNDLDAGQQETIIKNIQDVGSAIASKVSAWIEAVLRAIPDFLSVLPNIATVLIFSLLATFFISKDWYRFKAFFSKIFPKKFQTSGRTVYDDLKKALVGFIKAQATLISITAIIVLLGLLIIRVDYAVTIALIIGIVDVLPYLGTGAIFVPWIVYLIFANDIALAIKLGILYIIVLVVRQVMEPRVLSSSIGLDPLATLIALFVGFKLFGFLGLIIGPVALVLFNTLHHSNVFSDIWAFIIGKKDA